MWSIQTLSSVLYNERKCHIRPGQFITTQLEGPFPEFEELFLSCHSYFLSKHYIKHMVTYTHCEALQIVVSRVNSEPWITSYLFCVWGLFSFPFTCLFLCLTPAWLSDYSLDMSLISLWTLCMTLAFLLLLRLGFQNYTVNKPPRNVWRSFVTQKLYNRM